MLRSAVWISKGHFDDRKDPSCTWGIEGRNTKSFQVPAPLSLLICYDLDRLPVDLWRVGTLTQIDRYYQDGMTWFAETSMEQLLASSAGRLTGVEFHDIATVLLPAAGGWMGAPVELNDDQIVDIFDAAGWDRALLR